MKKIFFAVCLILLSAGSLRAQDTVTRHDPWYLYNTITSCEDHYTHTYPHSYYDTLNGDYYYDTWDGWRGHWMTAEGYDWFNVQRHYRKHGEYVYGIAVTAFNMPLGEEWAPAAPIMGLYNFGVVTQYKDFNGVPLVRNISVRMVDSLTILHQRNDCFFKYELNGRTPVENVYSPCHEFYFQHPYPIDSLTDSFYVALAWPHERRNLYREMISSWPDSEAFLPIYIYSVYN